MAYESMKTEDLKIELIRRTEDIDSWANEANIEKTKNDISDELDKGDKFNKQLDEKINKCIKKCRIFSILAIVSFVLSIVSFLLEKAYDSLYNAKIEGIKTDISYLQKELLDYITNHITDLDKNDCGALQIRKDDCGNKLVDIEWCDGVSAFDFDKVMALLKEKTYVTKKELIEYCLG